MEKQKIIDLWLKHGGTVQKVPGVDSPAFVYIDLDGLQSFLDAVKNGGTAEPVRHGSTESCKQRFGNLYDQYKNRETDDAGILIRPSIKIE